LIYWQVGNAVQNCFNTLYLQDRTNEVFFERGKGRVGNLRKGQVQRKERRERKVKKGGSVNQRKRDRMER
jgi:hypothetical protein